MKRRSFLKIVGAGPAAQVAGYGKGIAAGIVAIARRISKAVGAWFKRRRPITGLGRRSLWMLDDFSTTVTKGDIERARMLAAKASAMTNAAYSAALSLQAMAEAEGELDTVFLTLGKKMSIASMEYLEEYLQEKANNTGDRRANDER